MCSTHERVRWGRVRMTGMDGVNITANTSEKDTRTDEGGTATVHPESLSVTWGPFAEKMRADGEVPPLESWHDLLDGCVRANDKPSLAIWLLNLMRETGLRPTATTYEKMLAVCANHDDRVAAFHLVENICRDKILLDDVELPSEMADVLRNILPPDVF